MNNKRIIRNKICRVIVEDLKKNGMNTWNVGRIDSLADETLKVFETEAGEFVPLPETEKKYLLQLWCSDFYPDGYAHDFCETKATAELKAKDYLKKYKSKLKFRILEYTDVTPALPKALYEEN